MTGFSSRVMRFAGAAVLSGGLLLSAAGAASAVEDPEAPAAPVCSASPNPATVNGAVTLVGTGFKAITPVTIRGTGSATAVTTTTTTDTSGAFKVPEKVNGAGMATFTISGLAGGTSSSCQASTTVSAPAPTHTTQVGRVSNANTTAGQTTTFSGCGYKPGSTVTITDTAGNSYGTAPVGANGCFSKKVTFANPGDYTLMASGVGKGGGVLVTTMHVHVRPLSLSHKGGGNSASAGGSNAGGLAFTGADGVGVMTLTGIGLVAAGSGFMARGRRRRLVRVS